MFCSADVGNPLSAKVIQGVVKDMRLGTLKQAGRSWFGLWVKGLRARVGTRLGYGILSLRRGMNFEDEVELGGSGTLADLVIKR